MRLMKRLAAAALALALVVSVPTHTLAAENETNANRLHELGLFQGTGHGYALEQTATRLQGLIMLTRLLGEEEAALSSSAPCPFTDVAAGKPGQYVGHGYAQGYTSGTSATTFSPGNRIGFKHYVTFLLRALGYDDKAGDFTFASSLTKAAEIGMMDAESALLINTQNPVFYRRDLVDLSVSALTTQLRDGSGTLAEQLVARGVFSAAQGSAQKILNGAREIYTYSPAPAPAQKPAAAGISRKTGSFTVPSGTVAADIITVDPRKAEIRPAMVNQTLGKTAAFRDIVAASGADVVINGNFFEAYSPSQFPIGHVMADSQFLYGVSGLTAVGFTADGDVRFGRPALFFFVEGKGFTWACYECNSHGQDASTSVLYTPAFGSSVTLTCPGVITTVADGVIQSSQQAAAGASVPIPANGFVMFFGSGFASTDYYRAPVSGTSVTINPRLTRDDANGFTLDGVTGIVSGAPRLVEGGSICTALEPGFTEARFTTSVTPRTALGKTSDGRLVIVSTSAASIQQLRELMLQLGCTDAVNLDGGASTALAYQGKVIRNAGRNLTFTLQIFAQQ